MYAFIKQYKKMHIFKSAIHGYIHTYTLCDRQQSHTEITINTTDTQPLERPLFCDL